MAKKYFYSEKFNCIYSGNMQEGDRLATPEEVSYYEKFSSTLKRDIISKLEENEKKYQEALKKPLFVNGFYVFAEWITTFSNTYTLAKKYEQEQKSASANIIVLNSEGKMETIEITSLEEFEPFYNAVSDEWARIIDIRNKNMVDIQNSEEPQTIEIEY